MILRSLLSVFLISFWCVAPQITAAGEVERQIKILVQGFDQDGLSDTKSQIDARSFVPQLYAQRDFAPAWFDAAAAAAIFAELNRGIAQGFQPHDFHLPLLNELYAVAQQSRRPQDIATFDVLASDAAAKLLHYSIFGKVDAAALDKNWNFNRPVLKQDPPTVVNQFLNTTGFSALVDQVILQQDQYQKLMSALQAYRALAAQGGWPSVPDGTTLKPDMISEAVRALRYRLAAEHALNSGQILPAPPETGQDPSWVYDAGLVADVRAFQNRHGLEADGVIGAKTFQALNRTAGERADQIRVSLERSRWVMRDLGDEFVLVNIVGGRTLYVKGDDVWATRSVTGSQYRQTPVFRDAIQYMEINPTWTVPNSIFRKDKLARIRQDPGYLARGGYVVKNRDGVVIPAASVDWSQDNPPVILMQKPGPKNALGMVKFMFPNAHAVYLHDTDNRGLFERSDRTLSSGCVRIEFPFEFANLLMEADPSWSTARLQAILDSHKTTRVNLPAPVPVLLIYLTAWFEEGAVHFREDLYQRDANILTALNR